MTGVTELGYLGLSVSDLDAWKRFACGIAGMEYVDEGEGDRAYLRMDKWHHRIALHRDGGDDLAYLGWRVAGPREFDELIDKLVSQNIPVDTSTDDEALERHVLGLAKLKDPGGNPTEIFYGPQVDNHRPFHPGRPMFGRFVTGSEGVGHCILRQDDVPAAVRFVSVRARGVISGVGDGVFRGGACPTPECGVAGGHRVHRYGGVCTLQP